MSAASYMSPRVVLKNMPLVVSDAALAVSSFTCTEVTLYAHRFASNMLLSSLVAELQHIAGNLSF